MPYDFTDVNNLLQNESGRFGQLIGAKLIAQDAWNRLIKQEAFPEQMGDVINSLIWERTTLPDVSDAAWTALRVNDGSGNTCVQTPQMLEYARTIRSYGLDIANARTPTLCVEDIRFAWKFSQQLGQMYKILDENTKNFWTNRYRNQFLKHAGHHIVTDSTNVYSASETGTAANFPAVAPKFNLDQGFLDTWYLDLRNDSAEGSYATVDGQPQFALITSAEQSNRLKKQNNETRQDLRFSSKVDDLIKPFGVGWSYGNFVHLIDIQVPRFTFSGGNYTRVPFYTTNAASTGNKAVVNPAYRTAPYEVSFIFNPNVFTSRVPSPTTSPGGGVSFPVQNYRGDFSWVNNKDNNQNLTGKNGFFYAEYVQGSEPLRVEWGYAIMHLRCGPLSLYQSCS